MPETKVSSNDTTYQRWVQIGINAGFSLVVAAFLLWFIVAKLDTKLDAMQEGHAQLQTQMQDLEAQNETNIDQLWLLISVAQSTCINVADTPQERTSCVQVNSPR